MCCSNRIRTECVCVCVLGYTVAVHVYCTQDQRPIPEDMVEKTVINVVMSFYDGASNGNRTRGGIRKASEMYVSQ